MCTSFLWLLYVIGQTIIFLPSDFYLLPSSFFFCSPILSGRRLDVYHTSTHDAGLSANLECRSEMCCMRLAGNTGRKNDVKLAICAPSHKFVEGIFANKTYIDNRKKLVKQQYLLHTLLANVNSYSRSLYAIACPSVVCLSVVCNARAPYSGGWNFAQLFYGIWYHGHPSISMKNFIEMIAGKPLRQGS